MLRQIRVFSYQENDFEEKQLNEIQGILEAERRSPYKDGSPEWHFWLEVPEDRTVPIAKIRKLLDAGYHVAHPAWLTEKQWTPLAN